ncbi:Ger(x)C family spore germination protein [Paenibacillus sp. 5J-6]|uniref:Ger(X)C family spore germination protein n=1 Tax=Paenibacillus silvestris TaxID=2606219 RepID=A0A6L8UVH6_9BACL|nr:Ger(x)C family spore germination protein [Paenibacillus silvestris]MZQ81362.1 Ger(x)C family spore germination protein [Paenibacillus silvestris]
MSSVKRLLLLPVMTLFVLTGCGNEVVVNHIRSLTLLGFDKNESGYQASALYTDYEDKGKIKMLQGKSKQSRMMLKEIAFQSAQPIRMEKLKMLAFSKEVASEGITPFLKTICRDPIISYYIIMAIFDDTMASASKSLVGKNSLEFPHHLIEQNMKQEMMPRTNVSRVLFEYYGLGRDISLPYLKLNQKKEIEIAGYGIFKGDRLKLVLSPEEMVYYKLLQGDALRGDISFVLNKESKQSPATFTATSGKMDRGVSFEQNETKVTFNLELSGMAIEYPDWFSLDEEENTRSFAKQLNEQCESHLNALLRKFVKEGVDPVGIGDLVRSRQRNWTEEKFYASDYDNVIFDVHIETHLSKSGIGE